LLRNEEFMKQEGNAVTEKEGDGAEDEEAEQISGRKYREKEEISWAADTLAASQGLLLLRSGRWEVSGCNDKQPKDRIFGLKL